MLAWAHVLAWPVAAVWISGNARKAVAAIRPKNDAEKEVVEAALNEARAVFESLAPERGENGS
jgi:hypothetical protein